MRRATDRLFQAGVTLIEMIIAIVVGGILVSMVGMFGRWQIQSYFDVASRAALTDSADTALRRIARDLQGALPNSVRVSADSHFLEFVPIGDAGRYRAEPNLSGTGNILNFTQAADNSFDVLGPPVTILPGQQLVVYNLGISAPSSTYSGTDVYEGDNRRTIPAANTGTLSTVTFTPRTTPSSLPLPFASPANRFHIVGGPVSYQCAPNPANPSAGQIIRHWCYDFQAAQPAGFSLTPYSGCGTVQSAVLVDNVSSCTITYDNSPALQRNGLVTINLTLSANGENVNLLQQVEILNTP